TKATESTSSEAESTTVTPSATESSASATESQAETSSSASAKPSSGAAAIGANGVLALGGVAAAILALTSTLQKKCRLEKHWNVNRNNVLVATGGLASKTSTTVRSSRCAHSAAPRPEAATPHQTLSHTHPSAIMEDHDKAVKSIAAQVKHFQDIQKPFRIYHGSTNSTRRSSRRTDNTIDTSSLTKVISIDKATRIATSVEIVLATGEIQRVSKTENKELFWGAASAFGTLGVVTLLEVELREAKSHVQMTYTLSKSVAQSLQVMQESKSADYIDGITFSDHETVTCVGKLADLPADQEEVRVRQKNEPWYYIHMLDVLKKLNSLSSKGTVVDYMPIEDYLFRYDRGGFWVAKYAYRYFLTPFNRITRRVLNRFMHARIMYRAVHKSGLADMYMIQDVGVPYDAVDEFQTWLHDQYNIYPLWLCPLRVQRDDPESCHGLHSEFGKPNAPNLMNFGIWGPLKGNRRQVVDQNRALERKVAELGGKKWLYAHTYYTEDEFWAQYDKASYDALRKKYGAEYLPSVYDKVKVDVDAEEAAARATVKSRIKSTIAGVWPVRGAYGFYKAIRGGDYLLQPKK
ncbi:hypothetical protein Golomagni_05997, partial [Golovinomyces magnicellulatus]